ncbi:hypothetical protein [Bdellovibrio bacteriovorus]|uniref:hypothetical protein n=1 Tax=Bdellovibrio bacteriovorus TaxID=959 RepID=UPI0035A67884
MRLRGLFSLCVLYISATAVGCALEGDVSQLGSGSLIGGKGDFVTGNSNQSFTAVFKANNTDYYGVYDENTTSAVIGGKCTPGSAIRVQVQLAARIVTQEGTFCGSDGTWSIDAASGLFMGGVLTGGGDGLKGGSFPGVLVTETGSAASNAQVSVLFSPTRFPLDLSASLNDSGAFITAYSGVSGANASGIVRNIGLTNKKQYQYRFEIIRAGAPIVTMGPFASAALEYVPVPSDYSWQNGDTVRITAYDSEGTADTIDIPLSSGVVSVKLFLNNAKEHKTM